MHGGYTDDRAGMALSLAVVVASASAAELSSNAEAVSDAGAPKRNVRIIDTSANNAVSSDQSKWYNRVSTRRVQKNARAPGGRARIAR
jgi:hypothetical protein